MHHDHETPAHSGAIDPICGMTVEPVTAAARRVHEGSTYYFCSTSCAEEFDSNPAGLAPR